MTLRTLRIFLGAPNADTAQARQAVVDVVDRINARDSIAQMKLRLQLLRWNDPLKPVAMSFAQDPQRAVLQGMCPPEQCDLVIALLAHTMGGVLPE